MSRQPILFLFLDSLKIRNATKNKPEKLFAASSTVESHLVFRRHVFSLNSATPSNLKTYTKGTWFTFAAKLRKGTNHSRQTSQM